MLRYEQIQNKNFVTRFLHSFRYKELQRFTKQEFGGKSVRVLDLGCGPGGAFPALREVIDVSEYVGVDVMADFIQVANDRHQDERATFKLADITEDNFDFSGFDLIIALETFEHIVEGKLVRVIERIAKSDAHRVACSVPVEIGPAVAIKNYGSRLMGYNRRSGSFIETLFAATYQLNRVPTHDNGHTGFNWYWLEQTLRHNLEIIESRSLPYAWVPKPFAPTVLFKCKRKDN